MCYEADPDQSRPVHQAGSPRRSGTRTAEGAAAGARGDVPGGLLAPVGWDWADCRPRAAVLSCSTTTSRRSRTPRAHRPRPAHSRPVVRRAGTRRRSLSLHASVAVEYSHTVDGRAHAGIAYMYHRPASIADVFDPQNPAAHRAVGSMEPSNVDDDASSCLARQQSPSGSCSRSRGRSSG